jgi:hypothetical protein
VNCAFKLSSQLTALTLALAAMCHAMLNVSANCPH